MKKILLLSFVLGVMTFISCGDDTPSVACTYENLNSTINTQIDNVNTAIAAYNAENSEENCQAVKDAANAYLDAIEEFEGCTEIAEDDYNTALQAARDAVDTILC